MLGGRGGAVAARAEVEQPSRDVTHLDARALGPAERVGRRAHPVLLARLRGDALVDVVHVLPPLGEAAGHGAWEAAVQQRECEDVPRRREGHDANEAVGQEQTHVQTGAPAEVRLLGLERCLAGEAAAQKDLPPELRARVTAQRVVRTDERTVVLSVLVRGCRGTAESDLPVPARLRITHTRSGSFGNDASSLEREARLIPQIKRQVESKGGS